MFQNQHAIDSLAFLYKNDLILTFERQLLIVSLGSCWVHAHRLLCVEAQCSIYSSFAGKLLNLKLVRTPLNV